MEELKELIDKEHNSILVAKILYDKMFSNLVESISNAAKTCEGASFNPEISTKSIIYLQGKVDAYREVANRILKERNMSFYEYNDLNRGHCVDLITNAMKDCEVEKVLQDLFKYESPSKYRNIEYKIMRSIDQQMHDCVLLGAELVKLKNTPEYKEMSDEEFFKKLSASFGFSQEVLDWIESHNIKNKK